MVIDLTNLMIGSADYIDIDEDVIIDNSYFVNTSIRDLIGTRFYGNVSRIGDEYQLKGIISGIMVLPNSFTLEDYEYKFATNVNEIVDESDIFYDKLKNTLDIMEILWQNIVLEVPIQVGESNNEPIKSGEGWELVSEDTKKIDPRLAPLQELLKDKKEVENK